jgi:hypothetical protein
MLEAAAMRRHSFPPVVIHLLRGDRRRADGADLQSSDGHCLATFPLPSTTSGSGKWCDSALIQRESASEQRHARPPSDSITAEKFGCFAASRQVTTYNPTIPAPVIDHALAEEGRRLVERMRGIQ